MGGAGVFSTTGRREHLVTALLGLLVAVVISGFLLAMFASTSGRFVPQVVDLYLVAQYAKALAEGHPFQYNPGEAGSSGATSLLYTAWLGLLHALGARGEGLVAGAILTGASLFGASVALAVRVGGRLADPPTAALGGALVALGGPVVWGFLYGSDIALFSFLALLLFDRWLFAFETGRFGGVAVAGSLLALARPEGLPLGLLLAAAAFFGPSPAARRERLRATMPVAVAALVLLLQRAVTGQWLGTSVADKSLLANYGPLDTVALVSGFAVDVTRGLLLGFYPSEAPIGFARGMAPFFLPPLALLLVLVALATEGAPRRFALRTFVAAALLVGFLAGANTFMGVHFNRYLLWVFPVLLVLCAVGLKRATRLLAQGDPGREGSLFKAFALLFLLLGGLSTAHMAALYGASAGEIARRELPMAAWIRANLPPETSIANAATSIEYLTGHRAVNLHGVTSPAFFGNRTGEREAGLFESLSRLPATERPAYLLTTTSVQAGSALMRELGEGPPVHSTMSLGDDLLLFRLRADLPGRQASPRLAGSLATVAALTETDRLNVCDSRDEAAHGYRFSSSLGDLRLQGTVTIADYPPEAGAPGLRVADGGRAILGYERFRVRTHKGRPLVVVLRTSAQVDAGVLRAAGSRLHSLDLSKGRLEVRAGGQAVGSIVLRLAPGWGEAVFGLPAGAVGDGVTDLEVRGQYAAYHYWFYQ